MPLTAACCPLSPAGAYYLLGLPSWEAAGRFCLVLAVAGYFATKGLVFVFFFMSLFFFFFFFFFWSIAVLYSLALLPKLLLLLPLLPQALLLL